MLCEVVILELPTVEDAKKGALEKILFGPKMVVAKDDQSAGYKTLIDNAAELKDVDTTRISVVVRPFS